MENRFQVQHGKDTEAEQWAREVTEHSRTNYPEMDAIEAVRPMTGITGTVYLYTDLEDLGAFERLNQSLRPGGKWHEWSQTTHKRLLDIAIEGSWHTTVFRSV